MLFIIPGRILLNLHESGIMFFKISVKRREKALIKRSELFDNVDEIRQAILKILWKDLEYHIFCNFLSSVSVATSEFLEMFVE